MANATRPLRTASRARCAQLREKRGGTRLLDDECAIGPALGTRRRSGKFKRERCILKLAGKDSRAVDSQVVEVGRACGPRTRRCVSPGGRRAPAPVTPPG